MAKEHPPTTRRLWGDPVENVLHWAADHWLVIGVALSLVIDWTPKIKWNPWKSFFGWVGELLTKEIRAELKSIKTDLDGVKKEQERQAQENDENEMDTIRTTVLNFANSCRLKARHTKEEFDHIFALNDKYRRLLKKTGQENGRFEEAFDYIRDLYRKCMEENDFL